jgi:hypothetical protein
VRPDGDRLESVDPGHRGGIERRRAQGQERDRELPAIEREAGEGIARDEVRQPGGLAHDDRFPAPDHGSDAGLEALDYGVQLFRSRIEHEVAGRRTGDAARATGGIEERQQDVPVQALPAEHHGADQPEEPHRREAPFRPRGRWG